jgi:hypothetical protein
MRVIRQRAAEVVSPITGATSLDWSNPVEDTTDGWLFDPGGTTMPNEVDRQPITTRPTLYREGLPVPDVKARDRMVVDGVTYDVVGDPHVWDGGTFAPGGGIAVELEKVSD